MRLPQAHPDIEMVMPNKMQRAVDEMVSTVFGRASTAPASAAPAPACPTQPDLIALGIPLDAWRTGTWFQEAAWEAINRGHFRTITSHNGDSLYLLRCWLSVPVPSPSEPGEWDSGNSVLLHYIARPDDDEAMHDHPWDFTTTVLAGGYREDLPVDTWRGRHLGLGPESVTVAPWRAKDCTIHRRATDLHRILGLFDPVRDRYRDNDEPRPLAETWTLVRTGPRVRDWGFHPAGQPWVPWRQYLKQDATPAVVTP